MWINNIHDKVIVRMRDIHVDHHVYNMFSSVNCYDTFTHIIAFSKHVQQTTFEIIVAVSSFVTMFLKFSIMYICINVVGIVHIFANIFSKSSAADLLYVGKG